MKNLPLYQKEFIKRYGNRLDDVKFMLDSSGMPFETDYDNLIRLKEFGDFLLPFEEFNIFRDEKRASTNMLESVLSNTHLIIKKTNVHITGEAVVYKAVKWFLELLWPKTGIGRLPEFEGKFKKYMPDLHVPEIEVVIEYKLVREDEHPENHIDAIRLDAQNYKGNSNYSIFYAVVYFLGNKSHKEESVRQCWIDKDFPDNWKPIFVFG